MRWIQVLPITTTRIATIHTLMDTVRKKPRSCTLRQMIAPRKSPVRGIRMMIRSRCSFLSGGILRFLITGGAGFIGSHLAERLLERGDRVVLLDNLSTGSMDNIRHLKAHAQLQYHLDGIENRQLVAELVDDADAVVHLAAAVG